MSDPMIPKLREFVERERGEWADTIPAFSRPANEYLDLLSVLTDVAEAAGDAKSGWRYIRERYGDLDGVGWDRVENTLEGTLSRAEKKVAEIVK